MENIKIYLEPAPFAGSFLIRKEFFQRNSCPKKYAVNLSNNISDKGRKIS